MASTDSAVDEPGRRILRDFGVLHWTEQPMPRIPHWKGKVLYLFCTPELNIALWFGSDSWLYSCSLLGLYGSVGDVSAPEAREFVMRIARSKLEQMLKDLSTAEASNLATKAGA